MIVTRSSAIGLAFVLALAAGALSYAASFVSEKLAWKFGAVDKPVGERKIHTKPVPEWGGLGIAVTIVILFCVIRAVYPSLFSDLRTGQIIGFVAGIFILLVGGMIDDVRPLPPYVQILFPIFASVCVVVGGTGIVQVTDPFARGGFSLVWWRIGPLSLPADLLTFAWLVVATYATKILDGLDGLVAGMAVIGAGIVGALSTSVAFFQPAVAVLSGIVGGTFLGFLPRNTYPAKQFLGESGATIAGFSLGVLAILSSAKIAIALAVLAIPITDVILVVLGRIRRRVPWYKGDSSHLHFRLLKAGLSQRSAVMILWGASLCAGLLALTMQTKGKIFLIVTLVVFTAVASYAAGMKGRKES